MVNALLDLKGRIASAAGAIDHQEHIGPGDATATR